MQYITIASRENIYEIAEKNSTKHFEDKHCVSSGQTKQTPQKESGHNLESVTPKVSAYQHQRSWRLGLFAWLPWKQVSTNVSYATNSATTPFRFD
jgi:hypothetical protein